MGKIADRYFKLDPWKIIEEGWSAARNLVSESVFSLGNEYMGVRGYFEESTTAPSLQGSYFNGVYEEAPVKDTAYKGIITKTHFMVNAADWLYTRISYEGEQFDMNTSTVKNFRRVLDMKVGTLSRELDWITRGGKTLHLSFLRFLDMEESEQGFQRIGVTPAGCSGTVRIVCGIDFNAIHAGRKTCFWTEIRHAFFDSAAAVLARTLTTGQRVFSGFSWYSNRDVAAEPLNRDKFAALVFDVPLIDGEESFIEKKVLNVVEKNPAANAESADTAVWESSVSKLKELRKRLFSDAAAQTERWWRQMWENFDIKITGDEPNQQGIRFCIFQMQQTYHGQNPANNIGAKGLTGEAYNGHAFWDTETCCLPFYLFTNLKAAKNLLEFRYGTLDRAKDRAAQLDCAGACYPVATLNGAEACDLWQHASIQFQPSTGVAYGIAHYVKISGDTDFLYGDGAEMLVQISRFLLSRGAWNQDKSGFGFYAVMGPDEFHMMVSNNCYTNIMAKKTFEYTLDTLAHMRERFPDRYETLVMKTDLREAELYELSRCAAKMIVPYHAETKLFEQHEGYFTLPHIAVNSIPVEDFPLYYHWSYDRIYRTDMIKQPDVLMFLFLYGSEFPADVKRANYEFYEPRTIHESSLSPSIHSILAAELGKRAEAFKFFEFATRMDLDNYNRNTGEGLHTTSIAAAWMNIVYGFGGLRSDGDVLSCAPFVPSGWTEYEFGIVYRGAKLRFSVTRENLFLTVSCGDTALCAGSFSVPAEPVPVEIYGTRYDLLPGAVRISVPCGGRQ